jgi:xanthosine utilization system XapX-like protein
MTWVILFYLVAGLASSAYILWKLEQPRPPMVCVPMNGVLVCAEPQDPINPKAMFNSTRQGT